MSFYRPLFVLASLPFAAALSVACSTSASAPAAPGDGGALDAPRGPGPASDASPARDASGHDATPARDSGDGAAPPRDAPPDVVPAPDASGTHDAATSKPDAHDAGDASPLGDSGAHDSGADANDAGAHANDSGLQAGCPADPPSGGCAASQTCNYPTEACICSAGSPPTATRRWICSELPAGCPQRPPAPGSACADDGVTCNYGSCIGGEEVECTSGAWTSVNMICPG